MTGVFSPGSKWTTAVWADADAMALSLLLGSPAEADTTTHNLRVGAVPRAMAVNPVTNMVYVATDDELPWLGQDGHHGQGLCRRLVAVCGKRYSSLAFR